MATKIVSVIGTPGYLSEGEAMAADLEADEAAGFKPSDEVNEMDIARLMKLGFTREDAEDFLGLR